MLTETLKSKAVKVGKTLAAMAFAIVLAQAVLVVSANDAKAETAPTNGTCFKSTNICGLNGHNYSNYTYQGD